RVITAACGLVSRIERNPFPVRRPGRAAKIDAARDRRRSFGLAEIEPMRLRCTLADDKENLICRRPRQPNWVDFLFALLAGGCLPACVDHAQFSRPIALALS